MKAEEKHEYINYRLETARKTFEAKNSVSYFPNYLIGAKRVIMTISLTTIKIQSCHFFNPLKRCWI